MKKNINIPIILAALASLSACKDYYDEYPSFEELQAATGSVESQMGFSVGKVSSSTRMGDGMVQTGQDLASFRGIDQLYIQPFYTTSTSAVAPITDNLNSLGILVSAFNSIGATELKSNFSKYTDFNVAIPERTNAFLCYGAGPHDTPKDDGIVVEHNITSPDPSQISFSLQPIVAASDRTSVAEKGQKLADYLNLIYHGGKTDEDYNWTDANATAKWSSDVLSGVGGLLFSADADYTAGSSANVLAMVKRLYEALYFARSNSDVATVIAAIETEVATTDGKVTGWKSGSTLSGYPCSDYNLPDGAAYIEWDDSNKQYKVVTNKSNLNGLAVYSVEDLVYPPSLYYYVNSRIHTSEVEIGTGTEQYTADYIFLTNHTTWGEPSATVNSSEVLNQPLRTDNSTKLFTANGIVEKSTTVVAITKPLQYAVARFDAILQIETSDSEGGVPVLKDADNNNVPVAYNGNPSFNVTGIFITGQKDVDWKFETTQTTASTPTYTIYDSSIINVTLPTASATNSGTIHTLAFETYAGDKIYVAIEMENNSGMDFVVGANKHIVPQGCKFYLIGEVVPENNTNTSITHNKVLRQDEVTTVNFVVQSLANAYNVIPDFSADQLEFSLGVLDWKMSTPVDLEFGGAVN